MDAIQNRVFLDPLFRGSYPEDLIRDTAEVTDWSFVQDGDLALINAPLDQLGINFYNPSLVAALSSEDAGNGARDDGHGASDLSPWVGSEGVVRFARQDGERTAMDWVVDPTGMYDVLLRVHNDYGPIPMAVTENGAAFEDVVGPDGEVDDPRRIAYLQTHMPRVRDALAAGVDMRGYFVWSLLDNFEWSYGYSKRFGIVRVDFASGERVVKASGHWYRRIVEGNGSGL